MENVFMDEPIPVDVRPNVMERNELNLSRINLMYNNISTDSVLARGQEPMRDSSPTRLSASQVLDLCETLGRRGKDVSQPLTGLLTNLPGLSRDHVVSNSPETWMTNLKIRRI